MQSKIEMHNNRPTIFIDGVPYPPIIYALTDCPGGRLSYEEIPNYNISKFVKAGIRLYQLDIWLADMWFEDGTFDISMAKKQIDGITSLDSEAAIMFRFHTTPPKWWNEKYREECVDFADIEVTEEKVLHVKDRYLIQDLQPVLRHSYASLKWLEDASAMLIRFIEEFMNCEQSSHIFSIQIANGLYGENHYWAFMEHDPDTSKPMDLLYKQYKGDDSAVLPGMEERYHPKDGIFRNPESESNMIDYLTCQHELVAKSIVHFCRIIKDNWKGDIITGAFYCYYVSLFGRAAAGGHLAEEIVLESPYIDFVAAPQAYNRNLRNIGGAGVSRGLLESVRLHGKLLLDEVDHPTHIGTIMGGMKVYPRYESHQILRRNVITSYMKGMGFWYYDFGPYNNSGWWNDPIYMDEITFMQQLMVDYYQKEYKNNADVLLVFDTKVQKYTAHNEQQDPITDKACINISYPMALKSGASFDTVYLSDLTLVKLEKYKCVVFMNSFLLTHEQSEFILNNVYCHNRSVIWFFAPGYTDGTKNSLLQIEKVSKFKIGETAASSRLVVNTGEFSYEVDNSGEKSLLKKLFVPEDGETLGTISKNTGLAYKKFQDHDIYFSTLPFTTPEAFRYVFKRSGVHLYNDKNDALIEGSGLLMVHSEDGGERSITLKNLSVSLTFLPGETIVLDSMTGLVLRRG